MNKVYLDNAATSALRPEVIQEMTRVLTQEYGNPSSTHSSGRSAKNTLELARKSIAKNLNATAQEIIFTSGGTEGNNWIIRSAVRDLKITRIITSKIEHHAVLHAVLALQNEFKIEVDYVNLQADGSVDLTHLVELLSQERKTLVSLMHVNNEIGSILDLHRVGVICQEHSALFHTDAVQSVGKLPIDVSQLPIDFLVASAHKFHGPKGVGFAFIRKNTVLQPLFFGGEQEKGLRAGTEALHQIAGMAHALTLSYESLSEDEQHIKLLKSYLLKSLEDSFPGVRVNGPAEGLHTVVNILLPFSESKTAMILFHLDMKGIAVSRGSACQSGSIKPSHVLAELLTGEDLKKPSLRVSMSHYNTKEDIDLFVQALHAI
ncbi:cysteine desulfurase [Flavobacterium sp. K77]|uniref:cysteine desulfurase family protein n=1 Tax=Flavobacterium sp. K77 TaxID=2910676 RepID=UPI001F206FD6|nr:cysteine desulfurase family protein [Flavobacterium sp. K77]MCF6140724.1 cysteine desulfurase [Flavobacterium sp. K77]